MIIWKGKYIVRVGKDEWFQQMESVTTYRDFVLFQTWTEYAEYSRI